MDFNINVLDHADPNTQRLRDTLTTFGLTWSVNTPTRVTPTSQTAIDNAITNVPHALVSVINAAISDHFAQEVLIKEFAPEKPQQVSKMKRAVNPSNVDLLIQSLEREEWQFLKSGKSVNDMFGQFNDCLTYHLDVTCPFREVKENPKFQRNTWITPGILVSRERLKFYHEIFVKSQDIAFNQFYRNYKRIYRRVIKAAKAMYVNNTLRVSDNVSKTAWKIINQTTKQPNSQINTQILLNVDGKRIEDPQEVAGAFNIFFSSIASSKIHKIKSFDSIRSPAFSMVLTPVDEVEVARVVQSLPPKRSCDMGGMSMWLLKRCYRPLLAPLTKLINLSFESGVFPDHLKLAKVIPIFKKDDPTSPSNYRPISILPVFSKVFEKLFLERLMTFLERSDILYSGQFGFRKHRSTIDAVTKLIEDVVDGLERREHVLSIFLDLSKAFDCVHHETLLHQLEAYGIRGLPHRWMSSYLCDRQQQVSIASKVSEKIKMPHGVPQGSILGPVLFLIYVNNLHESVHNGSVIQYADDTTLCFKNKTQSELEIKSFIDLNFIIQNFSQINLEANSSKTTFMNFSLRQQGQENRPAVMMDDVLLEETDSTKFLGMYLDEGLTWDEHIDHICKKVSKGIYALRNLANFCSQEVLKMAYFGLIHPHLVYGIRLWGGCAKYKLERVFRLQKKAVRIIAKLNFRESCRNSFRELGFLTLPCLYMLEVSTYCQSQNVVRGRDIHRYETRSRDDYRISQHRTSAFEHLPLQAGLRIINKLPDHVKMSENQNQFKIRLKQFLMSGEFYSVDEFARSRWEEI